jgi:hypothetical protein
LVTTAVKVTTPSFTAAVKDAVGAGVSFSQAITRINPKKSMLANLNCFFIERTFKLITGIKLF